MIGQMFHGMVWVLWMACALPARAEDAVGRLNLTGYRHREMCTATLITANRALTAAHCVTTPQDGYLKRLGDMVFVAGWDGANHAGAARVTAVEVHPEAYRDGQLMLQHDIAVITLDQALDIPPLPLGSGGADGLPGPLTFVGYQQSAPHRQNETPYCYGDAVRGLWRIRCRVEPGQSGGPVLAGTGSLRRIVAVISAVVEEEALVVPVDDWLRAELTR